MTIENSNRYYFLDDKTKIVYYSNIFLIDRPELIYVGTSDNPKPKMAMAAFLADGKVNSGFKLREVPDE